MRSGHKTDEFHGVRVPPSSDHGAIIYPLNQLNVIAQTEFADGLCFGFTTSLMRSLLAGDFSAVQHYKNPISNPVIINAIKITNMAITVARDGGDIESLAFPNRKIEKNLIRTNKIPAILDENTNGALLIYKQTNGEPHQLLFFNKRTNKCIIQDPNRFTIDNLDIDEGRNLLMQIISRSNPSHVLVVKDVDYKVRSKL